MWKIRNFSSNNIKIWKWQQWKYKTSKRGRRENSRWADGKSNGKVESRVQIKPKQSVRFCIRLQIRKEWSNKHLSVRIIRKWKWLHDDRKAI